MECLLSRFKTFSARYCFFSRLYKKALHIELKNKLLQAFTYTKLHTHTLIEGVGEKTYIYTYINNYINKYTNNIYIYHMQYTDYVCRFL